jgi:hypothetical protein
LTGHDLGVAACCGFLLDDGLFVIPQGAHAEGIVVDAKPSGRLMGRARLQLALQSVDVSGQPYDVRTTSSARFGRDHKERNWAWIGGGGHNRCFRHGTSNFVRKLQ